MRLLLIALVLLMTGCATTRPVSYPYDDHRGIDDVRTEGVSHG